MSKIILRFKFTLGYILVAIIVFFGLLILNNFFKYDEPRNVCPKDTFMSNDEECYQNSPVESYVLFYVYSLCP